jgi:uncharacterized protein (TIGR00725 family)
VAVSGPGRCDEGLAALAEEVGRRLAEAGCVVLTGGRGGVMAAASRGARRAGGTAVGILPGEDARASPPNEDLELAIYTGMGQARNAVLALSAGALIAIGGGWGTLSEVALARKHGRRVVLLASWTLRRPGGEAPSDVEVAQSAAEAVALALADPAMAPPR